MLNNEYDPFAAFTKNDQPNNLPDNHQKDGKQELEKKSHESKEIEKKKEMKEDEQKEEIERETTGQEDISLQNVEMEKEKEKESGAKGTDKQIGNGTNSTKIFEFENDTNNTIDISDIESVGTISEMAFDENE